MSTAADLPATGPGLRQRQSGVDPPAQQDKPQAEQGHSRQSSDVPVPSDKSSKTYGRTPDGTVFIVPTTHDMVSQLLDPRQPKNLSDAIVLTILGLHILAAYFLPSSSKRIVFAAVFLFWRACYNIGIGVLLQIQSNHRRLVTWAPALEALRESFNRQKPATMALQATKERARDKDPGGL
ncbi:phosphatidylethanolamine N-methyltransferase [Fusarium oxysporum]|nr:phosphatidylethanolamine N-methyltransferase [Fusarium oxysporum]